MVLRPKCPATVEKFNAHGSCRARSHSFLTLVFLAAPSISPLSIWTWACAGNKLYYLVVLKGTVATCTTGREGFCKHNYYSAPAGIDKLDGKLWGGVKLDDFVVGGVNGYHANGDKNGCKLADPNDSKTASSLYDMGIRSPGVVGIPVCDTNTALQNWIDEERFGSHENYPCVPLDVVVPP
ncbi:hypothetical protein VE01_00750 [Pseudogymnoascus verrucosus]|uniref:Ecp2 effector protein domain-containing protein n=1 Tax=Pseudogymnoascus verrucosus TaxID=342668 RepID=A0A2P2SVV3_9PEZI|nr:uncharacterized protein VE01_00750 [Pseudogymnoascus verrucosus]OBU00932.1 hypothetical protein VE01_00750 [Pseudogymnoascus verrucosus]